MTASDCIVRGFKLPRLHPLGIMMGFALGFTKPRNTIIGMVLAGEVESAGENVTRFNKGDRVYGMTGLSFGCYAEYKCISEKECLVKIPISMSYEEAAAISYGGIIGRGGNRALVDNLIIAFHRNGNRFRFFDRRQAERHGIRPTGLYRPARGFDPR